MKHIVEFELDGKTVSLETGPPSQASWRRVVVRCGDTQVLVTATSAAEPRQGIDFFPLTVDYREYTFAAGRFPGRVHQARGRPSEKETVTSRMIDRPLRPLSRTAFATRRRSLRPFSPLTRATTRSIYAMIGASAAVAVSDIPVVLTTGSVRRRADRRRRLGYQPQLRRSLGREHSHHRGRRERWHRHGRGRCVRSRRSGHARGHPAWP